MAEVPQPLSYFPTSSLCGCLECGMESGHSDDIATHPRACEIQDGPEVAWKPFYFFIKC